MDNVDLYVNIREYPEDKARRIWDYLFDLENVVLGFRDKLHDDVDEAVWLPTRDILMSFEDALDSELLEVEYE